MSPTDKQISCFERFLNDETLLNHDKVKVVAVGRFLLGLINDAKYEKDSLTFERLNSRKLFFTKLYEEYKANEGKIKIKDDSLLMELTVTQFNQLVQDSVWTAMLDIMPKTPKRIKIKRKHDYQKRMKNINKTVDINQ